jgi:hypothetical protein
MSLLARFLGFGVPSWLVYVLAISAVIGAVYGKGYLDAKHAAELANKDAIIADVRAKLEANDEIRRQAEADAARAEAEAEKQKELLDELRKAPPSCNLTDAHVDGVRRIDGAP